MSKSHAWKHWSAASAVIASAILAACTASQPQNSALVQGWDDAQRKAWYNAGQGSRLMPLSWFKALEQPGAASKPFLDPDYLAQFRILPKYEDEPDGLPVGFATDSSDDSQFIKTRLRWDTDQKDGGTWVGLTCAACHTAEMTYGGKAYRIDGGPSLFDFQSFIEAVDLALTQTRDSATSADHGRWNRFAAAVLGQDHAGDPKRQAALLAALNQLIDWEKQAQTLNQTDLRYGYARVDAVGHIFNRILMFGGAPQPVPNPSDAPVSYPHLWNITKQTHLQWDGIAASAKIGLPGGPDFDYGAAGRNVGEVLGVFGEAVIKPKSSPLDVSGFVSSAKVEDLNNIEVQLTKLTPPKWPAEFGQPGAIDITDPSGNKLSPQAVLDAGHAAFDANCKSCHTPQPATAAGPGSYERMLTFTELGPENRTDEWMACNAWAYTGLTGRLDGIPTAYVSGAPLTAEEPVRSQLAATAIGVLANQKGQVIKAGIETIFGVTPLPQLHPQHGALETAKQARLQRCLSASDPLLAYKARPLEGIWATAPYLHNGSVPSLYALLQPPAKRPTTFPLGTRAFDPKTVGYQTDPKASGNSFVFDTTKDGNSNKGHVYGVDKMDEKTRLELLEYLKTL